jgi:hypothetical protein
VRGDLSQGTFSAAALARQLSVHCSRDERLPTREEKGKELLEKGNTNQQPAGEL